VQPDVGERAKYIGEHLDGSHDSKVNPLTWGRMVRCGWLVTTGNTTL
jgi:hypothetical protein